MIWRGEKAAANVDWERDTAVGFADGRPAAVSDGLAPRSANRM